MVKYYKFKLKPVSLKYEMKENKKNDNNKRNVYINFHLTLIVICDWNMFLSNIQENRNENRSGYAPIIMSYRGFCIINDLKTDLETLHTFLI